MLQPYDEIGAMGGLFAPAYIHGDPISEAAVARWNAAHRRGAPAPDASTYATTPTASQSIPGIASQPSQRDAIAMAMMGQQNLGSGGETGSGSLGDTAPSAPDSTGTPNIGTPNVGTPNVGTPNVGTPNVGAPAAAPGVAQGPANPSGTVTSAPLGPVADAPAPTFGPPPGKATSTDDPVFGKAPPAEYDVDAIMADMDQGKSVFGPPAPTPAPTPTPAVPAPQEKNDALYGLTPAQKAQVADPLNPQFAPPYSPPLTPTLTPQQALEKAVMDNMQKGLFEVTPPPPTFKSDPFSLFDVPDVDTPEFATPVGYDEGVFGDPSDATNADGTIGGVSVGDVGYGGYGDSATNSDGTIGGVSVGDFGGGGYGDTGTNADGNIGGVSVGVSEGPGTSMGEGVSVGEGGPSEGGVSVGGGATSGSGATAGPGDSSTGANAGDNGGLGGEGPW